MRRGSIANRAMKVTNEVFINSILSGWGTHAVNMTSNMINVMVLPMERAIGGALPMDEIDQYKAFASLVKQGQTAEEIATLFGIPPKANRKVQRYYDKALYKARHLIENFFEKLKHYRVIATRYDKTAVAFLGAIHLASCLIWLK